MKTITRVVLLLSMVSLFNDIASEMLYPVVPIYLKSIGLSALVIGIMEGVAEAISGLCKGYFGKLSDSTGKRLPFVQLGYGLSAISKPLLGMFTFPAWIIGARGLDRTGKGVRTGARDALLSDEATPETKGKVFGFHRSMDTLGAVLGPAFALLFLYFYPAQYRTLFFIAFIPGAVSLIFTFFIKQKNKAPKKNVAPTRFFGFIKYWKDSPIAYRKLVAGLLMFALINSSDMFLILQVKAHGATDTAAIGIYIFYNLVYAGLSYPFGGLGDKIGFKKVLLFGLGIFAIVYIGMGLSNNLYIFVALFFIYGMYTAATDGISKAWISNITDKKDTATAIGTFTGFQSICTLIASSVAGLIWVQLGAQWLFIATAAATVAVIFYLAVVTKSKA